MHLDSVVRCSLITIVCAHIPQNLGDAALETAQCFAADGCRMRERGYEVGVPKEIFLSPGPQRDPTIRGVLQMGTVMIHVVIRRNRVIFAKGTVSLNPQSLKKINIHPP